jgi:hypothetical protein
MEAVAGHPARSCADTWTCDGDRSLSLSQAICGSALYASTSRRDFSRSSLDRRAFGVMPSSVAVQGNRSQPGSVASHSGICSTGWRVMRERRARASP